MLTVTSGLAFVPGADFPTYCASKAALRSYTQSLRYQLQDTKVQVIEVVPPFVQTERTGPEQATNPMAMPLAAYVAETIEVLASRPDCSEVIVGRVEPQRYAEARGEYDRFFRAFNERMSGRVKQA